MRRRIAIAAVSFAGLVFGCGATGSIRFQELDPSAEIIHQTPTQVYAMDCQDREVGGPHALGTAQRPDLVYVASCTKDGGAIPWKALGAFQAGKASMRSWDRYRREVVEKAERRGCPGVLVRREAPTASSEAEPIGALCVDTESPSGISGPLRLISIGSKPLHVLADGESLAPLAAR